MPTLAYNPVRWDLLRYYSAADFNHPEKLDHKVVNGLDLLADRLHVKPVPIDDFRVSSKNPTSQHLLGRAIDFVVPGVDSLTVFREIRALKRFSGYGIYTNEKGAQSFHVDVRVDRTPEDPAVWGAWKDRKAGITSWQYTSAGFIIDLLKKTPGTLLAVLVAGFAAWYLFSKK